MKHELENVESASLQAFTSLSETPKGKLEIPRQFQFDVHYEI